MSIVVSDLSFAHPGADDLFFDVAFRVGPGEHWGVVGENGTGKTTILRVLAGELTAGTGEVRLGGDLLYLPQDIGFATTSTVRQMLLRFAPPRLRVAGEHLDAVEARLAAGDADAGMELGQAIAEWSELGGYPLEGRWDASLRRILGIGLDEALTRPISTLSGGERKRLALDVLFASDASVLLLDEADNYLDVPSKAWLEELLRASTKTIVAISHDREFLTRALDKIVTLEGSGAWVHGGSFGTYADARKRRQEALGNDLERWKAEERRLFRHMKIMKQRAAVNDGNAPQANAAESRWERFVNAGPPSPPAVTRPMRPRLRGGEGGRRSVAIRSVSFDGLIEAFSDDVRHNERVGLIGPNGTGKSHLLRLLAGELVASTGSILFGDGVRPGLFTQVNDRPDFLGVETSEIVERYAGNWEATKRHLARYGLERVARLPYDSLSGGQKARLEILALELGGNNLLLLDEPTDNLDVESAEALERALDEFEGACISVSHDRSFLAHQDRFWLLADDGTVTELAEWDLALDWLLTGRSDRRARSLAPIT